MLDKRGGPISGPKNWSAGYMPATYQATSLRSNGTPILNLAPHQIDDPTQRKLIDTIQQYNRAHLIDRGDNTNLAARISSYELAYKMQSSAPEAVDLSDETAETKKMYGLEGKETEYFGKQCLLARRLVERGVRFIQIYSGGNHNDANWDAHGDLKLNHDLHAKETDQPIAALIKDLKQRGMLEDTLVVWTGEFGRTPDNNYRGGVTSLGRGHNADAMNMWFAGGGTKAGTVVGATDEIGAEAVDVVHPIRDVHITLLHLLGLDDNKLTYFHAGRYKQLSQFGGELIPEIIA